MRTTIRRILAGLLALCLLLAGCTTRAIREDEKRLLVTIRDLEAFGMLPGEAEGESYLVKRHLDGSREIEYEYDAHKVTRVVPSVWLKSEAELHKTAEAAGEAFEARVLAYKTGAFLAGGGAEIVEDASLFALGERHYSAYVDRKGRRLGNVLVIQEGNVVLSLALTGLYFEEQGLLHELMGPRLEQARQMR